MYSLQSFISFSCFPESIIFPSLNSSFKNTGIIDKSNEARDSDQNFGVADAFQCTYTAQLDGGSIEVNDEKWNNRDAYPGYECGEFFKENIGFV